MAYGIAIRHLLSAIRHLMPLDLIIGAQWGDEGKGRITDHLAKRANIVARYSGGDNAGHTVTVGRDIFKLHLLPSGVIHPSVVGVLGNGMVINPQRLIEEMETLKAKGVDVSPSRIKISYAAHLITPAHVALDKANEIALGQGKIGTTGRGIGPAYTDKNARRGLRVEIFADMESAADQVETHIAQANLTLEKIYGQPPLKPKAVAAEFAEYAARLKPYITDTSLYLHQALKENKNVLAEGAQGSLLDIDHGTYPYVTSSSPTTGGAFTGLGIAPQFTRRVIGVTKAFQTRVGEGPFPTEAFGAEAERLRGTGANPWDEYGTTTGRPRRCGWIDLVLLRYSARVNGLTELAITKMDVLSGLDRVRLCVAYRTEGKTYKELPLGPSHLEGCEAVYEDVQGWSDDVGGAREMNDLPHAAREYLNRIETLIGLPIKMISVGPEREQIIIKD
jgi:adenylosuccinate synthase